MYLKSLKLFYFKPYFFFTLGQVIICSKAVPSLFANRGILLSKPLFLDIKYKIILEKQSCIDLFISPIRESNPYLPQDRWKSQHKGWNESSLPTLLSFFFFDSRQRTRVDIEKIFSEKWKKKTTSEQQVFLLFGSKVKKG